MAIAIFVNNVQHSLKLFCKIIYYFSTLFLVLLFIYVYYGKLNGIFTISDKIKRNTVAFHTEQNTECVDFTFSSSDGCLPCPRGTFSFSGWSECKPWLNCSDIARQVHSMRRIRGGFTKETWLADWNGHHVVSVRCLRRSFNCVRGLIRIGQLQGPFVTRLIGKCYAKKREDSKIITMYYKHGSVNTLNRLLQRPQFSHHNNIQTRFQLCVDYVKIMNFLHHSPIGTLIMCDTGTLRKLLSQYLITDDFRMVVNDLDGTPVVTTEGISCRKRKKPNFRPYAAPEQRWPNISTSFSEDSGLVYDEKVDIWKLPAVVEKLLGSVNGSAFAKSKLEKIMERCRATNPQQRPTANKVLQELLRVQQLITHKLNASAVKVEGKFSDNTKFFGKPE